MTPNVPLPAGAMFADPWQEVGTGAPPWRAVAFLRRRIIGHDAQVSMSGIQYAADSHVDDFQILVEGLECDYLNSDQARELAAALLEAADEMDRRTR
ncbi:hypothetical protein [Mycobacterium haemophilum]|uniref:Uncharacterized protein n=1 Tax=Mycobacterium haemophilum TaxID=29311 RepID=A0A0I9TAC7_9MYCO|nr:hypothetical protein [Mycobacterium haemophilum]KLO26324.1 hypothetical protein ABH39_18005 [Mycobacterium haemophilum]KLO34583.1 hypothetical protein ABH38_18465 [Mycobacterium haemophilum]KLO40899.1 hypothetical protein ABH37_14710 [Mycobacterium haemophilum]KLO46512.1 hypothetical protein ABH36_18150 [Mycobacterium haemophilum]